MWDTPNLIFSRNKPTRVPRNKTKLFNVKTSFLLGPVSVYDFRFQQSYLNQNIGRLLILQVYKIF